VRDFNASSVQVFDDNPRETGQGFGKCDLKVCSQVGPSPTEYRVFDLFKVENYVTRFLVRHLIGLAL
jgi:hypothetical protein